MTLADGQSGELPRHRPWVAEATAALVRGVALLIDYGYPATELYDPVRRATAPCAPMSATGPRRPLLPCRAAGPDRARRRRRGRSRRLGRRARPPRHTTQAEFLVGLGMDKHLRRSRRTRPRRWRRTSPSAQSVMRLLDPAATGRFRVMAFGRDWPDGRGSDSGPAPRRVRLPGGVAVTDHGRSSPRPIRHGGLQRLHPSPQTVPTSWGRAGWAWTNEDGKENVRPSRSS